MYAALETPSRLWKRVQALEKAGDQLEELPSLPEESSAESDYTLDSPQKSLNNKSRVLSPRAASPSLRDENARPYTPASSRTARSSASTVQASSKTARGHLSPLSSMPLRGNSPRVRSNLRQQDETYDDSSANQSSRNSSRPAQDPEDQDMSLDGTDTQSKMHTNNPSSAVLEETSDYDQDHDTGSADMSETQPINTQGPASLGLGHPGRARISQRQDSQSGTFAASDRLPSLTRSASASHSSPQTASSLESPSHSDVHINIHDAEDGSHSSDLSGTSSGRFALGGGNRFRLPRGPLSAQSSPMKPTPSRLRSAHSSPAVSTRDIRAGGENTPSAKRPLAGRAVSIGSTSLSSIHATLPSPPRDDIMATPRPAGSASDIERRKSHLLATLQLTAQRSQNRAKLNKGAATPLRNNLSSIIDGTSSEGGSSAAGSGVSGASNSTNDLNPHANSNHSLPLGDRSTRFNGAKLNSYLHSLNTHLTEENQQLSDALQSRDAEIQELRAALEEGHQGGQTADHTSSSTGSLSRSQRRREVELLQEQLQTRSDEVADLRDELLQVQSGPDGTPKRLQKEVFELKDKLRAATEANDEQLLTLEEKDKELEEVQADFSTKMKRLEDELCAVMEEQEGQLEEALQGNEQLRSENKELHDSQEKLQHELETVSSERDRLADALHSNDDQPTKGSAARLQFLEADVARLKETIDEIELEKKTLQQSNEELEEREEQLADSEQSMKNVLAARDAELAASRQQLDKTLQDNKNIERSLRAQLDSLQRQAGERQLDRVDKAARDDLKDQEIAHLSQAKADLETRVSSLRQQIDVLSAVNEAADKTMAFKPIIGVQTPKTPGYFRATNLNTSTHSDVTGVAFHHIDSLERQVKQLRQQLDNANNELDDKISKLSLACQGQLDASKELAATRAQLDRISSSDGITRAPENEAFNHFRDEIQCLEDELFKARQHIRSLSHRRSASGGNDAPLQEAHQRIKEMEQEREDLLAGIAGLHKDIQRVRLDAVELGKEISSTQNGSGGSMSRSLSAQEAHTLLALVRYLKARVTRENAMREDLAYQKTYFLRLLLQKMTMIQSVSTVLKKFNLPGVETLTAEALQSSSRRSPAQIRWSKAAKVTRAVARMSVMRRNWQAQVAEKTALQQAHATVRGRCVS